MFLRRMSQIYEVVIFTASISKYANAILDRLDPVKYCSNRLFRDHCSLIQNVFVKDLSKVGRDLKDVIILDNSPLSYLLHYENALPIKTWIDDKNDIELYKYLRFLEYLAEVDDVRTEIQYLVDRNVEKIDFELFEKNVVRKNMKRTGLDSASTKQNFMISTP